MNKNKKKLKKKFINLKSLEPALVKKQAKKKKINKDVEIVEEDIEMAEGFDKLAKMFNQNWYK